VRQMSRLFPHCPRRAHIAGRVIPVTTGHINRLFPRRARCMCMAGRISRLPPRRARRLCRPCRARGFTLIELIAVIGIVAVLVTTAIPAYRAWSEKMAVLDARNKLTELMHLQNDYHARKATFAEDIVKDLGAANALSDNGRYRITGAACGGGLADCVRLSATPVRADSTLQTLTLDSRGARTPPKLWR